MMAQAIPLFCLLMASAASAGVIVAAPVAYVAGVEPLPPAPAVALLPSATGYHAQDELGQHSYGYAGGPSSKYESKTADGVTRGAYSYIDANNIVQSVSYVADPVHGFQAAATNLPRGPEAVVPAVIAGTRHVALLSATEPRESPEVHAAKVEHFRAHAEHLVKLAHSSPE